MQLIKQSESTAAKKRIPFTAVSSSDVQTRLDASGLTFTVRVLKADGTSVAGAGTVSQPDSSNALGACFYTPDEDDMDVVGPAIVRISATGMEPREVAFQVVAFDPYDAATGTAVAALPTASAVATAVAEYAHESGRTLLGLFRRLESLLTGKATGLLSTTATFYRPDGVTKAIEATQNTDAGTRETASTVGGD